jgi:dTDP-4-dehydrorhamnose reductase
METEVVDPSKIAITGAGGLLGTALLKSAQEHEVYSLYNQHEPRSGFPVRVDLKNLAQLSDELRQIEPDVIIHAGALTDLDLCEKDHKLAKRVNCDATTQIARSARELGAFLVYVSTDYVFDGAKGMYRETDEPQPVNFYGRTKLMGEQVVRELLSEYLVVRASVIYGSSPSSGKVNFALWVLGSAKSGRPAVVALDQFVSPTLNINLAEMMMECVEKRLGGTLHLSGATRIGRFDFAMELCKKWSLNPDSIRPAVMEEIKWHAPRPRDSSLNVARANELLANKPATIGASLDRLKKEMITAKGSAS